jgi:hypothetical protein
MRAGDTSVPDAVVIMDEAGRSLETVPLATVLMANAQGPYCSFEHPQRQMSLLSLLLWTLVAQMSHVVAL